MDYFFPARINTVNRAWASVSGHGKCRSGEKEPSVTAEGTKASEMAAWGANPGLARHGCGPDARWRL